MTPPSFHDCCIPVVGKWYFFCSAWNIRIRKPNQIRMHGTHDFFSLFISWDQPRRGAPLYHIWIPCRLMATEHNSITAKWNANARCVRVCECAFDKGKGENMQEKYIVQISANQTRRGIMNYVINSYRRAHFAAKILFIFRQRCWTTVYLLLHICKHLAFTRHNSVLFVLLLLPFATEWIFKQPSKKKSTYHWERNG